MVKSITVEIVEVRGEGCEQGLKVGDKFEMEENHSDFCNWAHNAIFPLIETLRFGGNFPWEKEEGTAFACCPDPYNTVVFKIIAKE
jgi:uncharacterized repeat protein (TIGR04076 family)